MNGFTVATTTFASGVPAIWEPTTHQGTSNNAGFDA